MKHKILLKRYVALMIDILILFLMVVFIEFVILNEPYVNDLNEISKDQIDKNRTYRFLFYNFLLLFRDLKFTSIGKKILGLKIIADYHPKTSPKNYQLVIRNITIVLGIGIIEIFVAISNDRNKRIGDYIAQTQVTE